jgi:hypothetical protein
MKMTPVVVLVSFLLLLLTGLLPPVFPKMAQMRRPDYSGNPISRARDNAVADSEQSSPR